MLPIVVEMPRGIMRMRVDVGVMLNAVYNPKMNLCCPGA